MSEKQNSPEMTRGLKERHVQLIALGGTIGTGLFLGAGQSIQFAGPSILLAYIIAGFACFFLMRALGELLMAKPTAPSFITFINKYIGHHTGFVAGWTYWICWVTIAMAEITAAGLYMQFWFPSLPKWVTGVVLLGIMFLLNSVNVAAFGETEFWFAIIKVVAIIALIITGVILLLIHFKTPVGHVSISNLTNSSFFAHGWKGFFLSFQMVLFSFVGIEMIGMTASETKDPHEVIPKSINSVPMRIILFYIGSLLVLMFIYPWSDISADSSPFVQVFKNVGINSAAAIINFVVLTAAASSCNSAIFSTSRMLYSLAGENSKNKNNWLHRLSPKHHIPVNSIIVSTLLIMLAVLMNIFIPHGVFEFISSIATTCFLYIWGAIVVAHISYRHKTHSENDDSKLLFKMPGYPISDYFVLLFLLVVGIVMLFKVETAFALLGSIVFIIALYIFNHFKTQA